MSASWGIGISTFIIFYILPFIFAVILPAFVVPLIFKKIFGRMKKLPSISIFAISTIILAFLANLFWEFFLYNKVYYEWDRVLMPYSLFWHESPSTETPNWLAEGWTKGNLFTIWLAITVGIYLVSLLIAYLKNKSHPEIKRYVIALTSSIISLLGISLLAAFGIMTIFSLIFLTPLNLKYQENKAKCSVSNASEPRIIYRQDGSGETISNLDGGNLKPAFKKNLQLSPLGTYGTFSPDESMVFVPWGDDYWFFCLNTPGAFKISPPKTKENVGSRYPRSFPSWSPDSPELVMNNNGDLILINLGTKTTEILKKQVAIKDNNIDILDKDDKSKTTFSPYTVGSAFWSKSGLIYYTTFEADNVHLHQFNLDTNEDKILISKDFLFNINHEFGNQKYLILSENQWAHKYDPEKKLSSFLLNLETLELTTDFNGISAEDISYAVISQSERYLAKSDGIIRISPTLRAADAMIQSLDGGEQYNVTEITKKALREKSIYPKSNTIEAVQIRDFLNDNQILITIEYKGEMDVQIPRKINGILDFKSGAFKVLQDYPERTYKEIKLDDRLDPIRFVR